MELSLRVARRRRYRRRGATARRRTTRRPRVTISLEVEHDLPLLFADKRATLQMTAQSAVERDEVHAARRRDRSARASCAPTAASRIDVRDSGIGIAKDDIPKALAPSGQDRRRCPPQHDGTGLGLPIVNALMELHGGISQLESEVGAGHDGVAALPGRSGHSAASESAGSLRERGAVVAQREHVADAVGGGW